MRAAEEEGARGSVHGVDTAGPGRVLGSRSAGERIGAGLKEAADWGSLRGARRV